MSPFGPYDSHADCVAQNQDKTNPDAFCAWLEKELTGQWPGQNASGLPDDAWTVYREAYGKHLHDSKSPAAIAEREAHDIALAALTNADWSLSRTGWIRHMAAPKMRTLTNVRVFATGIWTDSAGIEREWTGKDVLGLVGAFNAGVPGNVPLKLGHTPDSFNLQIAEKMGVPVEVLTGLMGSGAPALGRMVTLELRGPLVVASFERVPEPIAEMAEAGLFNSISVEIEGPIGEFSDVITAVAMLGAEEPAVDLATLDRALVFGGKRANARVFTMNGVSSADLDKEFAMFQEAAEGIIKGMRGAPYFRAMLAELKGLFDKIRARKGVHALPLGQQEGGSKMPETLKGLSIKDIAAKFQISEEELMVIVAALGLEPTATVDDIVTAIEALKAAGGEQPPPGEPGMSQAAFTKVSKELSKAQTEITALKAVNLKHDYLERTRLFSAIPGRTAVEIAEELVGIHSAQGEASATKMLATFTELNKMGQAALMAIGSARSGERQTDYETAVQEYMKANTDKTRAEADAAVMKLQPALYRAYRNEVRRQAAIDNGSV